MTDEELPDPITQLEKAEEESAPEPAASPARTLHEDTEVVPQAYALWLLEELEAVVQAAVDARNPKLAVHEAGISKDAQDRAFKAIDRAAKELRG